MQGYWAYILARRLGGNNGERSGLGDRHTGPRSGIAVHVIARQTSSIGLKQVENMALKALARWLECDDCLSVAFRDVGVAELTRCTADSKPSFLPGRGCWEMFAAHIRQVG